MKFPGEVDGGALTLVEMWNWFVARRRLDVKPGWPIRDKIPNNLRPLGIRQLRRHLRRQRHVLEEMGGGFGCD